MPKHVALAITKTKLWILGGVLLLAGVLLAGGNLLGRAQAQDCDNNAIIRCGFSSPRDFIAKTRANSTGDLPAIYAAYGLEPSMYDKFVTSARTGTAYKDGRIVVDGQTVGTNGKSIGRLKSYQGSNPFSQVINGKTYWGNTNQQAFASNSIPVTVLFNAKGQVQFAVLNSCANPEHVTPVTPTYSCNALNKTAVSGQKNTYRFTTSASASHNATISKLVYDFGDNTATVTTTSPSAPVTHTFTKTGTFTIKVTVFVKLPGNQTVQAASAHCQTTVTVSPPPKAPKPPKPPVTPTPPTAPTQPTPPTPTPTPPAVAPTTTELPNTGAGNVIGVFVGSVATGFAAFRALFKFRKILQS